MNPIPRPHLRPRAPNRFQGLAAGCPAAPGNKPATLIGMNHDQHARLRAVLQRQREARHRLFDIQGQTINALRGALDAVSRTQDEMAKLFHADNDADDVVNDNGSA